MSSLTPERRGVAAMLFLTSGMNVLDVYGAVNSSPWTAETVTGGDPIKEKSLKRYCTHAIGNAAFYGISSAVIAGPDMWYFPVIGTIVETMYMTWLYWDAVRRGRAVKQGSFGVGAV